MGRDMLEDIAQNPVGLHIEIWPEALRRKDAIIPGSAQDVEKLEEERKAIEPRGLADRLDEGDSVPKGLALEGQPSLRLLQKARGSAQFGQGVGGSEQPVLIELDHDVSLLDDVARGKRGHPVVRQVPADKVEIPRVEGADVVADVTGARGVADEVDLALGWLFQTVQESG